MITRRFLNRLGSSFLDYSIILSIVGMALGGMYIYVKRGVQGRMRLFTDTFIGEQKHNSPGKGIHWSTGSSFSDSTRNQTLGSAETVNETSRSNYTDFTYIPGTAGRSNPDQFFNAWHDEGDWD